MTADSAENRLRDAHRNAVIGLAAEAHVPVELVAEAYRFELTELERTARIRQFLPVLATRRVRRKLRTYQNAAKSFPASVHM